MNNQKLCHTLIILFVLSFLGTSCLPQSTARRNTQVINNNVTNGSDKIPSFDSSLTFIQNSGTVYTSMAQISMSSKDQISLRGKYVDQFIRKNGFALNLCLVSTQTVVNTQKILIVSLVPKSLYNTTLQTTEYYYQFNLNDLEVNANNCQKTGLITSLNSLFGSSALFYQATSLCPLGNCGATTLTSQPLMTFQNTGAQIQELYLSSLRYLLSVQKENPQSGNNICTSDSECKNKNFDCCLGTACVINKSIKNGVDQNALEFLQAKADVLNTPAKIIHYPQYYNICPGQNESIDTVDRENQSSTEVNAALKRVQELSELYQCTNKINGEYGLCVKTFSNIQLSDIASATEFNVSADDKNFKNTFSNILIDEKSLVSIEKIKYGETILFDYTSKSDTELANDIISDNYLTIKNSHNDDLSSSAKVILNSLPNNVAGKDLKIYYKVDASCEYINSTTAQCSKYYVQGQRSGGSTRETILQARVTDHYPASNEFILPSYVDTLKTIKVEIDGLQQVIGVDWILQTGSPHKIILLPQSGQSLKAFDGQKIKITFFSSPAVMTSKLLALEKIKTQCGCSDFNCSLRPVTDNNKNIIDYQCFKIDPQSNIPIFPQTHFLSSKTMPMRFFDSAGNSYKSAIETNLPQEGTKFHYLNNDLTKPNNLNSYIGFQEIFGHFSQSSSSAKPAKEISVVKNETYDIYVDQGSFYTCTQCGSDYYSQMTKLFPNASFGSGLIPMLYQSSKTAQDANMIPADDFRFGRSCLVPMTMLPWSHYPTSDPANQRKNRLNTQHFLYSNGFQRDWFGFNYGAVIGSFDGVKWFSIGTNRRIKANTNKLFIAVNGIMGDLAIETSYKIIINDAKNNPQGLGVTESDFENDGASCQKFYQCQTDRDCQATLGPDYMCSSPGTMTTTWPVFDGNANEIPELNLSTNFLASIMGVSQNVKRCQYRGQGSLCSPNYQSVNATQSFNGDNRLSSHACGSNLYCSSFQDGTTYSAKYNNKVKRYGKVIASSSDTFGLGAQVSMRPLKYNGEELINSDALYNLNGIKAKAMCLPGRNPNLTSFLDAQKTAPITNVFYGDRVNGIGHTKSSTTTAHPLYNMQCGVLDNNNQYYLRTTTNPANDLTLDSEAIKNSSAQFITSNALIKLKSILESKGLSFNNLKESNAILNSGLSITKNMCLRTPGTSCFSDLECAPSKAISDKISLLSSSDSSVTSLLNSYEIKFWQEPLICSQSAEKTAATFDPKNNKCCRDLGGIISIGQRNNLNLLDIQNIIGVSGAIDASNRYSRNGTIFKEQSDQPNIYPQLTVPSIDQCGATGATCFNKSLTDKQFNSIALLASKTSCSDHWVRNFANGTHNWSSAMLQSINPTTFQCLNWAPSLEMSAPYTCKGLAEGDTRCSLIQTTPSSSKAKGVLKFFGKMELLGVPQIAIPSEDAYISNSAEGDLSCRSNPANFYDTNYPVDSGNGTVQYYPPLNIFSNFSLTSMTSPATVTNFREMTDGTQQLYSALDSKNFNATFKQIFKADEFVACLPAGTKVNGVQETTKCCSGYINSQTMRCALPDFVDVSLYTNKYISSEGQSLNANFFDEDGYIKDPNYVAELACLKNMCESKKMATGVMISQFKIPGQESLQSRIFRFIQGASTSENINGVDMLSLFKQGLKLNNHVYCIPQSVSSNDFTTYNCK